jgi:hypothetical protein
MLERSQGNGGQASVGAAIGRWSVTTNIEIAKARGHAPAIIRTFSAMRRPGAALLAFAVVTLLTACARTTESKQDDKIYKAYGDTWVYSKTEITTRYPALVSPHGLFGERNRYRERHLIQNSAGNTVSIRDNLYALQRDGALKKIECCQYFREKGDLYNIDDRLVFIFDNAREFITDCLIYPSGRPNNEFEPPEKRIYGVTVFAEFDPEANFFKIRTFSAGDNYLPFEYRAARLRTGRRDLTIQEHYAFLYARRKPFMWEGSASAPSALSTQPRLDIEAYQYGATRTVQIAVAPAATRSLVDRLQTFASRKRFEAWQAGTVERRDVSLALQGEEILTIVAGDDAGLWRVALYRRVAKPPSKLPSEESVDALLREVRNELEGLPGVRFAD